MALSNIKLVTFCVNAFHMHTETYRESPDPSFPVRDTESNPRWGWLGLACETRLSVSEPSNSSKGADDAGCLVPEASVCLIKGFHFLLRCQMQYFDWLTIHVSQ